ncbi:MAG: hypothetical protein PHH59_08030 [Methylovulum sp.]|uniref:hypothetical protein n=1 Tax=Methylovulum sp. TaxID=1916980 RepID=UPI00260AF535|nr:hypothetical protein [Methylovulum sp.]MDD2723953.1 hypothetical protein [Methylovulum sp.]MDD5125746.1 hypothetical protein [Methylovulum sp.]
MQQPIFIYTALPCEAKPFIEHFRLKKDLRVQAFAVFTRDNISLTVTGVGKSAMAAGVAYTQALFAPSPNPVLVNIGIAGHQNYPLGSLFLLNKITDADSQRCYYPPLVFKPPCATTGIQTSAKPQLEYRHDELCDMEASAFYEIAVRFSTGELIQAFKVVSDNQVNPITQVTVQTVSGMLATHVKAIVQVIAQLDRLAGPLGVAEPACFKELLGHYHFSVNEQQQLKAKLMRLRVLGGQAVFEDMLSLRNGKEVLRWLEEKIGDIHFYL